MMLEDWSKERIIQGRSGGQGDRGKSREHGKKKEGQRVENERKPVSL